MKSLKEKIEVMQAALDGKPIEAKYCAAKRHGIFEFSPVNDPVWNWDECDYRIEPQPPAKKTVAMQADDYPSTFWVRRKDKPEKMVLCIEIYGGWMRFSSPLPGHNIDATVYEMGGIDVKEPRPCEYSVDRKAWLPCTKEVDA